MAERRGVQRLGRGNQVIHWRPHSRWSWPLAGFDAASVKLLGMIPAAVDDVLRGSCPIISSYGAKDRMSAAVPKLAAALESQGIDLDLKIYRTAGHSFLNDAPVGPVSFPAR